MAPRARRALGWRADIVLQLVIPACPAYQEEGKKASSTEPQTNDYESDLLHQKQTKKTFLDKYYLSHWGQWAGTSVVCAGPDLSWGSYPPGVLSDEQLGELNRVNTDSLVWREWYAPEPQRVLLRKMIQRDIDAFMESERKLVFADPLPGVLFCHSRFDIRKRLPNDQRWVLRNLTTKQIVRSEAIAISREHAKGPLIEGIGFGEVLWSLTCWKGSAKRGRTSISEGVWAGHCFDITMLSRHYAETCAREWTDASEEVRKHITAIWEAEHGQNWREIVSNDWSRRYYDYY
ncbi:hypothetical protein NPX13_g31 [Xylaria arbuscula]|uniref:Uncharacterized protein n=1 Tax=Xylaria arbuscula TaxID=114810 RepID=A0A9W8TQW0_9PEZI|nr:hypothetical protein NPX13_g31 [Xylaria arbuscula]